MLRCQTARAVGLEARQVAALGQHVEPIAVNRRRAARAVTLIVRADGPRLFDQTGLPSARLSADTMLVRLFMPWTKIRSPLIATSRSRCRDPSPTRRSGGPDEGHSRSRPVSFDRPVRSGPCHCGQSPAVVRLCPRHDAPLCEERREDVALDGHGRSPPDGELQTPIGVTTNDRRKSRPWNLGRGLRRAADYAEHAEYARTTRPGDPERARPPALADEPRWGERHVRKATGT